MKPGASSNIGRREILAGAAALACPALIRRPAAAEPVHLIGHRYPALEYYAEKMRTALPNVALEARLMPSGEAGQLQRIAFSSSATSLDLVWCNATMIANYARNGWLEPLDALWAKHREEFNLGDINDAAIRGCTFEGQLYAMPLTTNVLLYAYRTDLFEEDGLEVPTSWDEQVAVAEALHSPLRSGTTLSLKWDMPIYELHSVLNTVGDGWFDENWRSAFASERGVAAIETYKRLAEYAVRGFTTQGNDENTVNFAQDICATGQQWATRCATMDDPQKSRVAGKIAWAVPPGGKQAITTDAYAISRRSTKDKDTLFRLIATALSEDNQRGAADIAVPPRRAVLEDPAVQARYRWYPSIVTCLAAAQPIPSLPEFTETAEISTKRMVQGIVGELPVEEALTTAAAEVTDLLTRRGYYKG